MVAARGAEEIAMPGTRYSNLQKLVALTVITLIAIFIAAKFTHGDADGTSTGTASDAALYSGNGGSGFTPDDCPALNGETPPPDVGAAVRECTQSNPGQLADEV